MTRNRWNGEGAAASSTPFHLRSQRIGASRFRRGMTAVLATALGLSMASFVAAPAASAAPATPAVAKVAAVQAAVQAASSGPRVEAKEKAAGYKVLVWTGLTGFNHTDGIAAGSAAITSWGAANGYTTDVSSDATVFTAANLAQYSTVVFLSTTGNDALNAAQKTAFENYIKGGGGFFGIHAAADSNTNWAWYGGLVGAYFKQHPAIQPMKLFIEDKVSPATVGLPDTVSMTDELYDFTTNPRDKVHVQVSIDTRSYTGSTMGYDHPMAWCQNYDGGRAAYNALGHDATNWTNAAFKQMILGGIATTAGVVPSDCGATVPGNFEVVKLDDNTDNPMMLDVAADKRVFYIERLGKVKVINPTTKQTTVVATLPAFTANESGVLGMVLDPNFATNNWMYIYWSPTSDSVDRISRFTVAADNTFVAGSEKIVLNVPVQRAECCHHGGSMAFNKTTGDLYLATGDNSNPFASDGFAPVDYRTNPDRAAWDSSRSAGNTNSLSGKVLRIHPEADGTYTVPAGNLFPPATSDTTKTKAEIFGMGFRNPFRINIDPKTGHLMVADYGPDSGSASADRGPANTVEWNIVDTPGNYGWPFCTGNNAAYKRWNFATLTAGAAYECATGPINDSPHNTGLTQLPPAIPADIYYHYSAGTDWPEIGGGGAPMAGPMYRYDPNLVSDVKWPAAWDGKALMAEWNNNNMFSILTDTDVTKPLKITQIHEHKLPAPDTREIKMMDSVFGPDGALYIIDWGSGWENNGDSGIYRIDYLAGTRSPIAKAASNVDSGVAPLAVNFSSAGSVDPDGTALTYLWTFGDGQTSTQPNPTHSFAAGVFNVQLTVTDEDGKTGVSNLVVTSGNARPVVTITGPKDGQFFEFGDQLTYTASVTDVEDGSTAGGQIPCTSVMESSQLGHVSGGSSHAHPMNETTGCTATIQTLEDGGHGGDVNLFWIIEVSYTDKGNGTVPALTGTSSIVLKTKRLQAEHFSSTGRIPGTTSTGDAGVTIEATTDTAGGTSNIGFMEPGDWFAYDRVNLTNITAISMRAAGTAGADFEIRWNDPVNGQLLGTVPGKATSGWQVFDNSQVTLTNVPTTTGTIYFVAKKAGTNDSVANVNWVDFIGKGATVNQRPAITTGTVTPTTGTAPLTVALAAAATDPEGSALSYSWDLGTTDNAKVNTANGSYTYTVPGKYTATLSVTDADGAVNHKTFTVTVDAPNTECFGNLSDEFTGTTLNSSRWSVIRGDQSLVVNNGKLTIPTSKTDIYGAGGNVPNIVLQTMPSGAWQATTKVNVKAYISYQQAGLIVYTDDDNYAKWVIQGRDASDKSKRVVQFAHEVAGSALEANSPALGADFPDEVYLRLTSDGTTLSPSYSVDGQTWISPTASWDGWTAVRKTTTTLGANPKIGVAAFANSAGAVVNADFDYFHISPDASATANTPNDEFNGSAVDACRWTTLRPDPTKIRVQNGSVEFDTITGEPGVAPNVLLQKQPTGNHWVAETKVDGSNFTAGYQQTGLIVYVDADNFVKLNFIRDTATNRRIELRSNVAAAFVNPQQDGPITGATDVWWLRLERQDNNFKGSYSSDGVNWTAFAQTVANIPAASTGKLGVYAAGVQQTSAATAKVDYFRILSDAPADTTAPTTTAAVSAADPAVLTLTATDNAGGSGVAKIEYRNGTQTWSTYTAPVSIPKTAAAQSVEFRATDVAGNVEATKSVSIPAAVVVDTTAPVTASTLNPATPQGQNGWYTTAVNVALAATDTGGSGVASTQYSVDGGAWTAYTTAVAVSGNGSHTVLYHSTDVAGNVEADKSVSVKIDAAAPVTAADVTGTDPVTIALSSADANSGVQTTEYQIGSGAWTAYTAAFTVAKTAAAQSVKFRSTDKAGNVEATRTVTVAAKPVELAASTTTLTIPAAASAAGDLSTTGSLKVTVHVTATSGIPTGAVSITVGNAVVGAGTLVNGTAVVNIAGLPAGVHQLVAHFPGDAALAPSDSAAKSITVYFGDYKSGQFFDDIMWLAESGITTGNPDGGFHPNEAVSRQAMAAFLYRSTHDGANAPACTAAPFTDVPVGNEFCGAIKWLASTGIANGFSDGKFRPGSPVARDAMAAFLYRLHLLTPGTTPAAACTTAPFTDVPVTQAFCKEISWLKAVGITDGNSDGTYTPGASVSRQAMAAFLHRFSEL
ncbi:DUF1349 domain-containing protein [Nakamurella silvestris]|nr:DUF1349 domain-containing protein [Nakamurella silvestris]